MVNELLHANEGRIEIQVDGTESVDADTDDRASGVSMTIRDRENNLSLVLEFTDESAIGLGKAITKEAGAT